MKIATKQYATTLYQLTKGKDKKDINEVINGFANVLVKNNDISKVENIIEQFEKKWNKEEGIVDAEVISSEKLGSDIIKLVKNYIKKISGAKEINIIEQEDKKVLGGIVIKYGDKVLDGSLKTRLEELKNNMVK